MVETSPSLTVGVDMGGRSTRAALLNESGAVVVRHSVRSPRDASIDQLYRAIESVVGNVLVHHNPPDASRWQGIAGAKNGKTREAKSLGSLPVGVAIPGTLNAARNQVVRSVCFPCLESRDPATELSRRLASGVRVCTDAEAATWGEYLAVTRRPARFVHLRIGTGVACGVVIDGQLLRLDKDRTAHLDVLVVDQSEQAPLCPCGLRGCLENIVGGRALSVSLELLGIEGGLAGLQQAWSQHRSDARSLVQEVADATATTVQNLVNRFEPDFIALGGGVITHLPALGEVLTQGLEDVESCKSVIHPCHLGDDAGVMGAGLLSLGFNRLGRY